MRHKTKICSNQIYRKAISYVSCLPSSKGETPQIAYCLNLFPIQFIRSELFLIALMVLNVLLTTLSVILCYPFLVSVA